MKVFQQGLDNPPRSQCQVESLCCAGISTSTLQLVPWGGGERRHTCIELQCTELLMIKVQNIPLCCHLNQSSVQPVGVVCGCHPPAREEH